MILTLARTALLPLLAVKGKSVPLLGVQIPFYGPDGFVRTIIFLKFPQDTSRRNRRCNLRQQGKDGFSVTKSTVILLFAQDR